MNETQIAVDAAVVVAPLMIVGAILKNAFKKFPNRMIPLVILLLGMPAYMAKSGAAWDNASAWVTAFLCVATAVGVHSGIKNSLEKEGDK